MYRRSGSCNRCGQCCGATGSPNRDSPWPNSWPESVENWQIDVLAASQPIFTITGHPALGGQVAWTVRIGNKNYNGRWVPGHGLCLNTPPLNDPDTWEEQCPFLSSQEPDGSYPCALAGTPYDAVFQQCMAMKETGWTEREKTEWETNHPLCSYVFVPE